MNWLSRERVNNYPWVFIVLYLGIGGYWIFHSLFSGNRIDPMGTPIGADFIVYWVVSSFCLDGNPAAAYDIPKLNAAFKVLTGSDTYQQAWNYSPTVLLMVLPLALLPYFLSLFIWLSILLSSALIILRNIAPHPATMKLALAFPGTFQNFMQGQNGFLSASLLGSGLLLLDRFPFTSGFFLGLMSYKPHLAVLVPIALIAGKRWRALSAAIATAGGLILFSLLLFGLEIWKVYLEYLFFIAPRLLDLSHLWAKMITVFASVRLLGGSKEMAWGLQGVVTVLATAVVFWVWRQKASYAIRSSVLILGTLLATPYAFDYDLFILSLPIAWVGWEQDHSGWKAQEKFILLISWLSPFIVPTLAKATGFQIGPIIFAVFLILLVRRVL
jgi:hypothetical protein